MAVTAVGFFFIGNRVGHHHAAAVQRSTGFKACAALSATAIVTFSSCVPLLWPLLGQTYPENCPIGRLGWILVGSVSAIFYILMGEMYHYGKPTMNGDGTNQNSPDHPADPISGIRVTVRRTTDGFDGFIANDGIRQLGIGRVADDDRRDQRAPTPGLISRGRALGTHKLIPRLSPGKTREGAIGGIVIATIVAFVCLTQLFPLMTIGAQVSTDAISIKFLGKRPLGRDRLGATAGHRRNSRGSR